ncbi:MAG: extracellular solute-binding protein [Clostridia bacterium]|nr:extracellular solute-binding protein [Clostridia bacterium]
MKKLLSVILAVLMLTSCAAALADEPVRVAWWGSETSNVVYLTFSDMFTEATGIEYEAEYLSWGDYWTKINTLAAANDMPDMVRMDYAYIKNYVDKGLLLDLTDLVNEGKIDLSDVADSAISGGRFGDGLYGINAGSNGLVLAVNAKLVTDAGLEVPTNEMTWEEFVDWCIEFHDKTGKFGTDLFGLKDFNVYRVFARQHNEELYNEAQDAVGYSVETLAAYFTDLKKLHDAGAIQNVADVTVDIGKENYPFAKAEAATNMTVTDSYTTYAKLLYDEYGALELRIQPGSAENKAMFVKPSQFLSIAASAEQVDKAAAYIDYWTNDEAANLYINGTRGIPISAKISSLVASNLDEISALAFDYMQVMAEYSSDLYAPDPVAHTEIGDEFVSQLSSVLFNNATPEEAAQKLIDFSNKALNN